MNRTQRRQLWSASVSVLALVGVPVASPAFAQDLAGPGPVAERARTVAFTVPLRIGDQVFGDVLIETDGSGSVQAEGLSLRNQLRGLLNERGQLALDGVLLDRPFVGLTDLQSIGINLRFDESQLLLVAEAIPGELRSVRTLGDYSSSRSPDTLPVIEPAHFSSYVNINANLDYSSRFGTRNPDIFVDGATRFGRFVLEYDAALTDQFSGEFKFQRRGVRAVYDQPERFRRFSAGDLRVPTAPLLRTPFLGGVAVEKRRRLFDPYLPVARLGGREIFLDNASTVEVLINGERYESLQLEAGRYDLSSLPVQLGDNNVQLRIRDSGGREQIVSLDYFYEPLDLPAGEDEYVLAAGLVADDLAFEPDYTNRPAITAFYRRGMSDTLLLGGGVQLSERVQAASLVTTIVPQILPGALDLEVAASTGTFGTGFASRGSYRFQTAGSFVTATNVSLNFDYESANYQTLADVLPINFSLLSIGANASRGLSERTYLNLGAIYSKVGNRGARSTLYADVVHRLTDRLRATAGIEYGSGSIFGDGFGVRLGITMAFGGSTRGAIDYRSRTETLRANIARGSDDYVGSFGWDLGVTKSPGQTSADAAFDYVGNRFEARALFTSNGRRLGDITDEQRARLQIGSSLAFADGTFGIGRPIFDSFALVHPHPALDDTDVVSARSLDDNRYDARSGTFGAGLQGDLASYNRQDIQFDVAGGEVGVDIGDGIVRVAPPYRAGYNIEVGSAYFVSASGNLMIDGQPASLANGTVTAVDDEEFSTQPFFTNSAGRFAIIGLAPNSRYVVTLREPDRSFTITTPDDGTSLLQLGRIELTTSEE